MEILDYMVAQEELHQLDIEMSDTFSRLSMAITTAEHDDNLSIESIDIVSDYIGYNIANEYRFYNHCLHKTNLQKGII